MVDSAQVAKTTARLAEAGIKLVTPVPERAPALAKITLRHRYSQEEAVSLFFGDSEGTILRHEEPGRTIYRRGNEILTFYDNGAMIFRLESNQVPVILDSAAARRIFDEFWVERGGLPDGARFDSIYQDERSGKFLVYYYQEVDNRVIYGGQAVGMVGPGGLETVLLTWFDVTGSAGRKRAVIPPTDALEMVAGQVKGTWPAREFIVEALSLGYFTEPYNARQWEAVPVWRVRFRDGRVYYVNAYTGEMEMPSGNLFR
ncbi:MAG: PepSY domain-containing protein [Bacillota bacterium]